MRIRAWSSFCIAALLFIGMLPSPATAGTTGGVTGRVVDASTQKPVADVSVTANSPSQTASTKTDANGNFSFLSLIPDTYTVSFQKYGYAPISDAGISIFADQVQTLNVPLEPSLKTIASVRSRSSMDVVKAGTTSDVYSVNATGAQAAQSLVGPGGLSNAYGAIASVPGVAIDPGEQGWFQTVHIRGGDIDQVGWELDGIPVNRVYDNAPQTMLSSLGQQELQVYTGGTPASADAQGIAGYVNQVIRTGTYPGFGNIDAGIGGPAFYHKFSVEAGGSNPARTFSYYAGFGGADQTYRYVDNNNGANNLSWFFYPVNAVPGNNGFVFDGNGCYYVGESTCPTPTVIDPTNSLYFTTGAAFGLAYTNQRDSLVNLHFAIPHKSSALRDDVQMLWMTSEIQASYYSSPNDLVPAIAGCACTFGPLYWDDAWLYTGQLMQPLNPGALQQYAYPSSPVHAFNNTQLPLYTRDTNDNGVGIGKLQYQHQFSENAFLRVYGYSLYSNWFIDGPNSAAQPLYGAELADYEIPNHTYGANVSFTDQLSAAHLLTASAVYTATDLQRYSAGFFTGGTSRPIALDTNASGTTCYNVGTGAPEGCYFALSNGDVLGGKAIAGGSIPALVSGQWTAVDHGLLANLNQVQPRFSGMSLNDEWRPSDRWTVNAGIRLEDFTYLLGSTSPNDPARQFWFSHYNAEFCFGSTSTSPVMRTGSGLGPCPTGTLPLQPNAALGETQGAVYGPLVDKSGGQLTSYRSQPRFGFTDTLNNETVLRGSAGVYARPQNTSWVQYNTEQENLAGFIGAHFYSYGFNTPEHDLRPDTSYNFDLSLEKRLHGTDWSYKVTPFLRFTRDQLQNFFIDPLTGLESGLNVGQQTSYGLEFALRKGDFNNQGWSGELSYTYTHSRIKYQNFPNGSTRNVIDNLNSYIQNYNDYTSYCAAHPSANVSSPCYYPGYTGSGTPSLPGTGNAPSQCYTTAGAPAACGAGNITNPYWNAAPQTLMDRNGEYTTYDVIPGPVSGENGYETPNVASVIINYRHDRFAITPSLSYNSGASYGAPLSWPGYRPDTCGAVLAGTQNADPVSCTDNGLLPLFTPDPFNGNKFDSLGAFRQPWRVSLNVNMSYDVSSSVTADLLLTNIVDYCGQRGYAWDNPNVCVYSNLPTGIFYPAGTPGAGGFFPNSLYSSAPVQMKYPYSFWLNNNNTGFLGVKIPFQATFNLHFKV
jgi:hypothetical protein